MNEPVSNTHLILLELSMTKKCKGNIILRMCRVQI